MGSELFLGLMSGTSKDGVDAVIVRFDRRGLPRILAHRARQYPPTLRRRLMALALTHQPAISLHEYAALDLAVAREFAAVATGVLRQARIRPQRVRAIGSHGQTVFHDPARTRSSLQLGNPNLVAALTGIDTVADFRRADIAAGGQGAPLAPAFHRAVFGSAREARVVLNLGGIANVTLLPKSGAVSGFDTGPANALLDEWAQHHRGVPLDRNGAWARSGKIHPGLLRALLSDPYLRRRPPKSTGRDYFNLHWLARRYPALRRLDLADVQRTLLEFTARSVVQAIARHAPRATRVLVCGGGVRNGFLVERLAALSGLPMESTARHGTDPQQVEATAFAWLARRTLLGQTGNLPSVTGAKRAVVLGGIYPA